MALLDKGDRRMLFGMGIGAGALLALPYVGPVLATVMRPLVKAMVAQTIAGFEKASEAIAHGAEALQDLLAEIQAEQAARDANTANTAEVTPPAIARQSDSASGAN